MGMLTLGEATCLALKGAARPASRQRRTSGDWRPALAAAPVRRGSVEAGTFEEGFFAAPAKGETDRLLHVARRTLDAAKRLRRDARKGDRTLSAAERAIAALTAGAVRVYEELLTLARLNRGRVFPSYDHLAAATGLGRATVARAMPVLERIGFLARQRRFRRIAAAGTPPRYAQTSNVYRAMMPPRVLGLLPRWMRPAPLPCDETVRRNAAIREQRAMLATLNCRELAEATLSGRMGHMLARLGAALDRRCESQDDTGTPTKSIRSRHGQPSATTSR